MAAAGRKLPMRTATGIDRLPPQADRQLPVLRAAIPAVRSYLRQGAGTNPLRPLSFTATKPKARRPKSRVKHF